MIVTVVVKSSVVKTSAVEIGAMFSLEERTIVGIIQPVAIVAVPGRIVIINISGEIIFIDILVISILVHRSGRIAIIVYGCGLIYRSCLINDGCGCYIGGCGVNVHPCAGNTETDMCVDKYL